MAKLLKTVRNCSFICRLRGLIPEVLVNYIYHFPQALLAISYYGYPAKDLKVIGVTGTDGKTTTATLIYEILKKAGLKTALISTVSAKIGSKDLPTGLHVTSPHPWELQRLLKLIRDKGFKYLVLETTSHGLEQFRLLGANFYIGLITNVTHEHLDYHKTFKNYLKAKAKLFKKTKFSVLNQDDSSFAPLKKVASGKIISYGLKSGDYHLKNFAFKTRLLGEYNLYNCLAAISVAKTLGIKNEVIRQVIADFKGMIGRMEEIKTNKGFRVFVDFAHTPNGLKNALKTLKSLKPEHLMAVFGAAGLRDRTKRPLMGQVACQLADKVILTAEDPRTEAVNQIIKAIASGCKSQDKIIKEPDRQKAINLALKMAQKGDIVGIFGKGHEQSLCFGTQEYPWSDQEAVKKALKKK